MIYLRNDKRGVAGFFEDIPSLIVVSLALTIFIASIIGSFIYYASVQYNRDDEDGQILLDSILSYPYLKTENRKDGNFDLNKLKTMTPERLEKDIHTDLQYKLDIIDVSDYPDKQSFNFTVGNENLSIEKTVISIPVTIYAVVFEGDTETRNHGAVMRLTYWRVEV